MSDTIPAKGSVLKRSLALLLCENCGGEGYKFGQPCPSCHPNDAAKETDDLR